jgi:glyoxylase-like metal-dependent hydrolase (beta-lactamase superfamily II)
MADREGNTPHPPATPEFGHVSPGGPAHEYPAHGNVHVVKFSVGAYDNNVYLLSSSGEAIVVDGAAEPDRIIREISSRALSALAVVETHNHPDHTAALPALVAALTAPVLAHAADRMPVPTESLEDGQRVRVGEAEVVVLHTPGHTPGSLSFLVEGFLFSGDTLFPGGPGNTEGSPAAFDEIMRSVDRLFQLPEDTLVCPGHGLDTTIGRERPYLEVWRKRGW